MNRLELLLRAVDEQFPVDATRPSVTCSFLGRDWYASVLRYSDDRKFVVASARGDTFHNAVDELVVAFLDSQITAMERLRRSL